MGAFNEYEYDSTRFLCGLNQEIVKANAYLIFLPSLLSGKVIIIQ
jgi:hypothetical protein